MRQIWKPTPDEADMIRRFGKAESTETLRKIELGIRCNTEDRSIHPDINIARVTRKGYTGDWEDTDLWDYANWSEFRRRGVELTEAGEAIVDFYLYGRDNLGGNVTLYYSQGSIERIHGYDRLGRDYYNRGEVEA